MRTINKIVIHCSATVAGLDTSSKDINRWHKERGWRCIGYHYVVRLDGRIELGRHEGETGAHVLGHNKDSIGVCYIGGLDKKMKPQDTRTREQKEFLALLLSALKYRYPGAEILGHRDFPNVTKACPCFDAKEEYEDL